MCDQIRRGVCLHVSTATCLSILGLLRCLVWWLWINVANLEMYRWWEPRHMAKIFLRSSKIFEVSSFSPWVYETFSSHFPAIFQPFSCLFTSSIATLQSCPLFVQGWRADLHRQRFRGGNQDPADLRGRWLQSWDLNGFINFNSRYI